MRKPSILLICFILILSILSGCAQTKKTPFDQKEDDQSNDVTVYMREKTDIQLADGYNQYIMDYSENGMLYFVSDEEKYQFYFQTYGDEKASDPLFEMSGGYVRDLSAINKGDGFHFCFLWRDESTRIFEYDQQGKACGEVSLDGKFDFDGKFPILRGLPEGGYLLGLDETVYWIWTDGGIKQTIPIKDGIVRELVLLENGQRFVVYQETNKKDISMCIAELDLEKGRIKGQRSLPIQDERVFAFSEEQMAYCTNDFVYLFDMDEAKDEKLIDLKKQSIMSSQIKGVYGNREEIFVISYDSTEGEKGNKVFRLTPRSDDDTAVNTEENGKAAEKYAPDGRRIVRVAVPKGERNTWILEYRAQKYTQDSDTACIEVDLFDGTLEDYLGRGERPDVVMLHDQAAIAPLVELGALADLNPLYENQNVYSIEDLIPKAREALSVGDGLYAMAGMFELLLVASDGTELNEQGSCNTLEYLRWYDSYLSQNAVTGMGNLDQVFFAIMPHFYDEKKGEAYFQSEEFKELMREYKNIRTKHKGELSPGLGYDLGQVEKAVLNQMAKGPSWLLAICYSYMGDDNIMLTGIPSFDAEPVVCMRLQQPLAILDTSDCKEEAFDFVMYACKNITNVQREGGKTGEQNMSAMIQTYARFFVFEDFLKEEIWETEKPYLILSGDYTKLNSLVPVYITEERKEMLRDLMNRAVGVTKAQNDIYGMFLEEMGGYINGNKDLESCCDILQNRASLYLVE